MRIDRNLEISKIIRAVMKLHGRKFIFNNLNPSGVRTVKCYMPLSAAGIDEIRQAIRAALLGITKNYEMGRTMGNQNGRDGFIVRLLK